MSIEFKKVKIGQKFSINGNEYIKHNEFKAKRAEDHWKSSPHLWDIYPIKMVKIIS